MTAPPHAAWLVDLDGTLYAPLPVKLLMGLSVLCFGLRHAKLLRQFRREHEVLRETMTESVEDPFALQLARTAEKLGRPTDEVERVVRTWMLERPLPFVRRFRRAALLNEIERYRAGGGKTALVSDYPARGKLAALGAERLFDVVVASGEPGGPGRLKPWPDGYLKAAEALGIAPSECLVIGDRADADGLAASQAGMTFRHVAAQERRSAGRTVTRSAHTPQPHKQRP
ncbi:MAG: HAD family hydrolase [Polyangiaceae bacterium]|nr:HAD family hydrolase [Polyangiaceae bacterium]MCW5790410.1 HAD family hydrolase [Polyangiaceae bacterium]